MVKIKNRKARDTPEFEFKKLRYTCFSISKKTISQIQHYLTIPEIHCVFSTMAKSMIVEWTLVWWKALSSDQIFIALEPDGSRKQLKKELPSVIAHEVHHSQRISTVGYGDTLFEVILSEGLACHFEHMLFPEVYLPYIISNSKELLIIIDNLPYINIPNHIEDDYSIHDKRFFQEYDKRPKRSWYKLGYEIVDIICKKLGKNAGELVNASFSELESEFTNAIKILRLGNHQLLATN